MTVQEEAIRELKDYLKYDGFIGIDTVQMVIEALQFQQSVVKCKDCELYQTSGSFCTLDGLFRDFEEYCSRGERRDEE